MQGSSLDILHERRSAADGGNPLQRFLSQATPQSAYKALASLPTEPTEALQALDAAAHADPGSVAPPGGSPALDRTDAQLEFDLLTQLLWNGAQALPPQAGAAAFRALAAVPGVTAQRGVLDAAGRPAIALSVAGQDESAAA